MHPQAPAPCAPAEKRAGPAALRLQIHPAYVPSVMLYAGPALSPPISPALSSFEAVTPGTTGYPVNQPAPSQGVAPSNEDFVLLEGEWELLILEAERVLESSEN
jgi:hypothetical protein